MSVLKHLLKKPYLVLSFDTINVGNIFSSYKQIDSSSIWSQPFFLLVFSWIHYWYHFIIYHSQLNTCRINIVFACYCINIVPASIVLLTPN